MLIALKSFAKEFGNFLFDMITDRYFKSTGDDDSE